MNEPKYEPKSGRATDSSHGRKLAAEVDARARRKLRARRHGVPGVWFGLGMVGLVGWSVVVPTLLGAGLGVWLDKNYPGPHSWTLALLVGGLALGCFNAWHWVAKEGRELQKEAEDKNDVDA